MLSVCAVRLCCASVLSVCAQRLCCASVLSVCAQCLCSVSVLSVCTVRLCSVSVLSVCAQCLCSVSMLRLSSYLPLSPLLCPLPRRWVLYVGSTTVEGVLLLAAVEGLLLLAGFSPAVPVLPLPDDTSGDPRGNTFVPWTLVVCRHNPVSPG